MWLVLQGGLFEQLTQLLAVALKQEGKQRAATIRYKPCGQCWPQAHAILACIAAIHVNDDRSSTRCLIPELYKLLWITHLRY